MGWGRGELGKAHFTGAGEFLAQEGHDRAIHLGRCPISVVLEAGERRVSAWRVRACSEEGNGWEALSRTLTPSPLARTNLQTCEHAF